MTNNQATISIKKNSQTAAEKIQKLAYKWLFFLILGVSSYGAGLYFGVRKQHQLEAQKIINSKDVSGSSDIQNNIENLKSPTERR